MHFYVKSSGFELIYDFWIKKKISLDSLIWSRGLEESKKIKIIYRLIFVKAPISNLKPTSVLLLTPPSVCGGGQRDRRRLRDRKRPGWRVEGEDGDNGQRWRTRKSGAPVWMSGFTAAPAEEAVRSRWTPRYLEKTFLCRVTELSETKPPKNIVKAAVVFLKIIK